MTLTRRRLLGVGGFTLAALVLPARFAAGAQTVEIAMQGRPDGSHVWFDPVGVHVPAGTTLRWTNRDAGNSHTVTAYHPTLFDRPLRIPEGAEPWDSGYLLPEESFSVTLTVAGVYDYYCQPHEHAGMVGRIVVGDTVGEPATADGEAAPLPEAALANLPPVADILARGTVRME
jgi:plastocyanin